MTSHLPPSINAGLQPQGATARRVQRWRMRLELALWRHGAWPLLALAALAVVAWLVAVERPGLQARLAVVPSQAAARPVASVPGDDDAQRWAALRAVLPPREASAEAVQRLVALTGQDLAWRQAEFLHSDDVALGLTRLQISVPVTGSYPALRQALVHALQEMPALAIDQVLFQRQSSGDAELQARVRFSIWLAREAVPAFSPTATAPGGWR